MSTTVHRWTDRRFARRLLEQEDAFRRVDEGEDAVFYRKARTDPHLDSTARATVKHLIGGLLTEEAPAILDLMASWDSHLPASLTPEEVIGLGLNAEELMANTALDRRIIQDLNTNPVLPLEDRSIDVVLNVASVEYLVEPIEVFRDVGRVLRPGGLVLVVFSDRWYPPKVVRVWEEAKEDERIQLVEMYLDAAGAFEEPDVFISVGLPRPDNDPDRLSGYPSDPVFAVFAEKAGGASGRPPRIPPEDPADLPIDHEAVEVRKRRVGETLRCPYCQERLSRWEVPDDPAIDWPNRTLYLCFNDACPFLVRGWRFMWDQGNPGVSYRYLFNPETGGSTTVPIRGLQDLRPGITSDEGGVDGRRG